VALSEGGSHSLFIAASAHLIFVPPKGRMHSLAHCFFRGADAHGAAGLRGRGQEQVVDTAREAVHLARETKEGQRQAARKGRHATFVELFTIPDRWPARFLALFRTLYLIEPPHVV
jgi:hypothetical protein